MLGGVHTGWAGWWAADLQDRSSSAAAAVHQPFQASRGTAPAVDGMCVTLLCCEG
jgi:hypothetical protein